MKLRMIFPTDSDDIDLTALIDCIFLLVLFFMVTSSFIEESQAFKVELPRADNPEVIPQAETVTVGLTLDNRYFLREGTKEPVPMADLEEVLGWLKEHEVKHKQTSVIVRCDARSEYQQYVQIVNMLKVAGIERYFQEVEIANDSKQP